MVQTTNKKEKKLRPRTIDQEDRQEIYLRDLFSSLAVGTGPETLLALLGLVSWGVIF